MIDVYSLTQTLPLAPREAWRCLTDPDALNTALPRALSIRQLDSGEPGRGSEIAVRQAQQVAHWRITHWEPPKRITLERTARVGQLRFDARLTPVEVGSQLTLVMTWNAGPVLTRLSRPYWAWRGRRLAEWLLAFSRRCAGPAAHDPSLPRSGD